MTVPYWDWTKDQSTDPKVNHLWRDYFLGGDGNPEEHQFVSSGPFAYWPLPWGAKALRLSRKLGNSSSLPTASQMEDALHIVPFDLPSYRSNRTLNPIATFRKTLDGSVPLPWWPESTAGYMHNRVHGWVCAFSVFGHSAVLITVQVGGEMSTTASPNDPLFFLHHCYVDKMWTKWIELHPEEEPYLPLTGGPLGTNIYEPLFPFDGLHNVDEYDFAYQYQRITSGGQVVRIQDVVKPTQNLGYVYA